MDTAQAAMGRLTGVHPQTVSDWERGASHLQTAGVAARAVLSAPTMSELQGVASSATFPPAPHAYAAAVRSCPQRFRFSAVDEPPLSLSERCWITWQTIGRLLPKEFKRPLFPSRAIARWTD